MQGFVSKSTECYWDVNLILCVCRVQFRAVPCAIGAYFLWNDPSHELVRRLTHHFLVAVRQLSLLSAYATPFYNSFLTNYFLFQRNGTKEKKLHWRVVFSGVSPSARLCLDQTTLVCMQEDATIPADCFTARPVYCYGFTVVATEEAHLLPWRYWAKIVTNYNSVLL